MKRTSLWDTRLSAPIVVRIVMVSRNRISVFTADWYSATSVNGR